MYPSSSVRPRDRQMCMRVLIPQGRISDTRAVSGKKEAKIRDKILNQYNSIDKALGRLCA